MTRTLLALAALLLAAAWSPDARARELAVGDPHPEIRLPTVDGEATVSLQSLRGSKVLLIQFASW